MNFRLTTNYLRMLLDLGNQGKNYEALESEGYWTYIGLKVIVVGVN